ncbi:hypothetical protein AB0B57_03005 [Micromonospora sp. NPDC049101]|uniref:hypothetical protein n=1 Tax=Micromonospora sp. NPDC049101 TaxID=3155032 RepID=UPI003406B1B5
MAVYNYRLANDQTRWFFIIDLPPDANGRRRQHKRQGLFDWCEFSTSGADSSRSVISSRRRGR